MATKQVSSKFLRFISALRKAQPLTLPAEVCEGHVSISGQVYPAGSVRRELKWEDGELPAAGGRYGRCIDPYESGLNLYYVEYWPQPSNHAPNEVRYCKPVLSVCHSDGRLEYPPARDCWMGRYRQDERAQLIAHVAAIILEAADV